MYLPIDLTAVCFIRLKVSMTFNWYRPVTCRRMTLKLLGSLIGFLHKYQCDCKSTYSFGTAYSLLSFENINTYKRRNAHNKFTVNYK